MDITDLVLTIIIIMIFMAIMLFNIYFVGIQNIKDNWPEYRCNPLIIPFAGMFDQDVMSNLQYCVQNMTGDYMSYLMQPIEAVFALLSDVALGLSEALSGMFSFIDTLRDSLGISSLGIFSIFGNLMNIIESTMNTTKDMTNRMVAIVGVFAQILSGVGNLGNSIIKGPPGQLVEALADPEAWFSCFHPDTKIRLEDGRIKKMKQISLGDILENGSTVLATMKIKNHQNEEFYKIRTNDKDLGKFTYVTGSHLVKYTDSERFIYVRDHNDACKTNKYSQELSCLITDDHLIKIGNNIFWDWED